MFKKCLCILVVFTILLSCFSYPAFADDPITELGYFLESWFYDTSIDIGYSDNWSASDLVEWYSTPEGRAYLISTAVHFGLPAAAAEFVYLQDANNHQYMCTQLRKNQVNELYNMLNDFWSNDSAPVRNSDFYSIGFTLGVNAEGLIGNYGYISGSGSAVCQNESGSYLSFNQSERRENYVYLYNGSIYYPPILYVPCDGAVYRYGDNLRAGFYVIVDDYNLLFLGNYLGRYEPIYFLTKNNSSTGGVNFYSHYVYDDYVLYWDYATDRNQWSDRYWRTNNDNYSGDYILNKFVNAIGYHVSNKNDYPWLEPDSDIPYDDNDTVTVLVPIDDPARPIYISPTTYNNYIDNGTYTVINDNVTNNIVSDDDVTNITNIYNNNYYIDSDSSAGGGVYDDHNLLRNLSNWFSSVILKIDTIIDILNNRYDLDYVNTTDIPFKWLDPDPIYDNFTDCIFNNIPLFGIVRDTLDSLNNISYESEEMQSVKSEMFSSLGVSVSSSSDTDVSSDVTFNMPVFEVIFDYIEPHKDDVRNLLQLVAYSLGFVSFYKSTCSLFGIHISVSDLKG